MVKFFAGLAHAACSWVLLAEAAGVGQLRIYKQCGGANWKGSGTCATGLHCDKQNKWFSQCVKNHGHGSHSAGSKGGGAATHHGLSWPSLFCFSLVVPGTSEPGLLAMQVDMDAGVFACDGHLVVSNKSSKELFGEGMVFPPPRVATFAGETWAPARRGSDGRTHVQNTPVFQKAWEVLFHDGTFRQHDWTLKLDVDAVAIPQRVRVVLGGHKRDADGRYKPLYIQNAATDAKGNLLHGPVEALSSAAVEIYALGANRCRSQVTAKSAPEEDLYLNNCLKLLGVPAYKDLRLLRDAYVFGKSHVDCSGGEAVFHPLRSAEEWSACAAQAGGEHTLEPVSFAVTGPSSLFTHFSAAPVSWAAGITSGVGAAAGVAAFLVGAVLLRARVLQSTRALCADVQLLENLEEAALDSAVENDGQSAQATPRQA